MDVRKAAIVILALWSTFPEALRADTVNFDAVRRKVIPVLQASRMVGRIYYRAVSCDPVGISTALPSTQMRTPSSAETGTEAMRDIFKNDKHVVVTEGPTGLIRVTIGDVPGAFLKTKIPDITLNSVAQYNAPFAIDAILQVKAVRESMRRLGMHRPMLPYDYIIQSPMKGVPHLPSSLKTMTVDQAFDVVAQSFHGIVWYGVCERSGVFQVRLEPVAL